MQLELTPQEYELVEEILQEHQRELRREIARVEHREFKAVLRDRETRLESVSAKLGGRVAAAA